MSELVDAEALTALLSEVRTIAVLGAHVEPSRPAFYVPDYLASQGYTVLPVNPTLVGQSRWGQPFVASLAELQVPVDLVDVFRRSALVMGHTEEILSLSPPPRAVWMQQGVRSEAATRALVEAGLDVVQDRCTLADHRRFAIGPVGPPSE